MWFRYLGRNLAGVLLRNYKVQHIRLLDICLAKELSQEIQNGLEQNVVEIRQIDIRDVNAVVIALEHIDVVFHIASYGMSGKEQLQKQKVFDVNYGGTENIIQGRKSPNAVFQHGLSTTILTLHLA